MRWKIALDIIEDVRGSIAMYMFIIEEAVQTAGMAAYLYNKAEQKQKAKETAQWILDNLIYPAQDFTETYGYLAYPLNMAYDAFFKAAEQTMQMYLEL